MWLKKPHRHGQVIGKHSGIGCKWVVLLGRSVQGRWRKTSIQTRFSHLSWKYKQMEPYRRKEEAISTKWPPLSKRPILSSGDGSYLEVPCSPIDSPRAKSDRLQACRDKWQLVLAATQIYFMPLPHLDPPKNWLARGLKSPVVGKDWWTSSGWPQVIVRELCAGIGKVLQNLHGVVRVSDLDEVTS